jgi:hypothetical protein
VVVVVREVSGVWRGSERVVPREVSGVDSLRSREVGAPLQSSFMGGSTSASASAYAPSSSSSTDPTTGEAAGYSFYARSATEFARPGSGAATYRAVEPDSEGSQHPR